MKGLDCKFTALLTPDEILVEVQWESGNKDKFIGTLNEQLEVSVNILKSEVDEETIKTLEAINNAFNA